VELEKLGTAKKNEFRIASESCKAILIAVFLCAIFPARIFAEGHVNADRTVVDSRGVEVTLPNQIDRVATVSDGLVEGVMTVFGVEDRLVGIGSRALRKVWSYRFDGVDGETFSYTQGMHPLRVLNPWFADLPLFAEGPAINYESLLSLQPDLVILRMGACNLPAADDRIRMILDTLDSLGLPTVVLHGPYFSGHADLSGINEEIRILGRVFGKPEQAESIIEFVREKVQTVEKRTKNIPSEKRPEVMVLGLSPAAREKGAAGQVFGKDTIESYFIEEIVRAKNAFQSRGHFKLINTEHLLAINPDVIILCTAAGYHPPRELYEASYYQHLRRLKAVKQKRVMALPWSPWNCEKRLEYPIDIMVIAKAAYPERFNDIDLASWLLDFYQGLYGVDRETAEKLRSAQWMDWTFSEEK
jgi:iron complex transport system substrate-binding protein